MATVSLDALRSALDRGELVFHYQPKVSMVLGTIVGAEALLRWCPPGGPMIGPAAFIPLAETSGFIREITLRMLEPLVVDLAILRDVDDSLSLSFNASGRDFDDQRLVEALLQRVERGLIPPQALELELTETAVLAGGPAMSERLGLLSTQGISLAMDDFGTGYSSIDTLSRLPFTTIKIDQGIVQRMNASPKDASIVESSIRMGHRLGFEVVAEGIETELSFKRLQAAGCTTGQGYWMGRPMPLEQLLELLRSGKRWPAGALGLVHMAALDHLEWRKALLDGLLSETVSSALLARVELDPTMCRLGRWYCGPGRVLSDLSAYGALDKPHAALHECAAKIVEASNNGASIRELLPWMRELTEHSTHIIALLQGLEHAVLSRMTRLEQVRAGATVGPCSQPRPGLPT